MTSIAHQQPAPPACTGPIGTVYLLHFERPYRHARHYSGWTADLIDRLWQHAQGHGARLMTVVWEAGIGFTLVRVCEGTRGTERSIKNAAARSATARCAPPVPVTAGGASSPPTSFPATTPAGPRADRSGSPPPTPPPSRIRPTSPPSRGAPHEQPRASQRVAGDRCTGRFLERSA